MFKILIVEDDRGIAEGIQSLLEQWGMEARQVQDFRNITGEFETYQPHLISSYWISSCPATTATIGAASCGRGLRRPSFSSPRRLTT